MGAHPVVFLDIDGVLVTFQSPDMRSPTPRCVRWLNELCRRTGAVLVVSSVWRINRSVPELQQLLRSWGVEAHVADRTPWHRWSGCRGDEIAEWLKTNAMESPFVIIDDDSDMGALLPWLVQTKFQHGMTRRAMRQAVKVLRDGVNLSEPTNQPRSSE